jgi:DNA-binding transcriptional ArsR family regulator
MGTVRDSADLLKALAHPARLEIAHLLRQGEACVCHLEAHLGYRQAYISQQIMVLRKAGVVAERHEGTYVFYRLADPRVVILLESLNLKGMARARPPSSRHAACSCPRCAPEGTTGLSEDIRHA